MSSKAKGWIVVLAALAAIVLIVILVANNLQPRKALNDLADMKINVDQKMSDEIKRGIEEVKNGH